LSRELTKERGRAELADAQLSTNVAETAKLKTRLDQMDEERRYRFVLVGYVVLLAMILSVAGAIAWQSELLFPETTRVIAANLMRALVAILVFVGAHLIIEMSIRDDRNKRLWPFRQLVRFRRWLWAIVIMGFVFGVIGNLYPNRVQKQIDLEQSAPGEKPAGTSSLPIL